MSLHGWGLGTLVYWGDTPAMAAGYIERKLTPPQCPSSYPAGTFASCEDAQEYSAWWYRHYTSDSSCATFELCKPQVKLAEPMVRTRETTPQPLPVPVPLAPSPNPMAFYTPGGCDGPPVTDAEASLMQQAQNLYTEYVAAVDACNDTYMPDATEAALAGNQLALSQVLTTRNACGGGAASQYMPQIASLVSQMESVCANLGQPTPAPVPTPTYPKYTFRSLPPSRLAGLGTGCGPNGSMTAEQQVLLGQILELEDQRHSDYGACLNEGRGLIQNAMNARAPVADVVELQQSLIACVDAVLDSYADEIDAVVSALEEHCASAGVVIDVVEPDPPADTTDEPQIVNGDPVLVTQAESRPRGMLVIGSILLVVAGAAGYALYRGRK